jgi:hypothetical protein
VHALQCDLLSGFGEALQNAPPEGERAESEPLQRGAIIGVVFSKSVKMYVVIKQEASHTIVLPRHIRQAPHLHSVSAVRSALR